MADAEPGSAAADSRPGSDAVWQLPRGPHKLPREVIVDHQRQRILAGAARAAAEHGYAAMSVENVLVEAGVSRTTFYENFDNKRDCVLAAHEQVFNRLSAELVTACAGRSEWPAKVVAAMAAAIEFATRAPEEAQLLAVEAMAADPALVSRTLASSDFLVGLLRNGREQCPRASGLPELTERALIGAITSIVGSRLISGQADQLRDLEPQLVQLMLMPYVGIERARQLAEGSE
jgi:AcrR family transcriptional regulator